MLVLQYRYRGGECPKAAKGGCCFLGTGRSPGRTGSGDCVVISLHLRLFGPTSGRRKGEKERECRRGSIPHERKETQVVPGERAQYHRRAGECGSEVPDTSPFGLPLRFADFISESETADLRSKVHARIEISTYSEKRVDNKRS